MLRTCLRFSSSARPRGRTALNESGAAEIVALMVAVAIGGVVMSSNMEMFSNMTKGMKGAEQTSNALEVRRDLEAFLGDERACTANFVGKSASSTWPSTDPFVEEGTGNVYLAVGSPIPNQGVRIIDWSLSDSNVVIDATPPARRLMLLTLRFERLGVGEGSKELIRTIGLYTRKVGGPDTAIRSCYSLAGSGSDIWLRTSSNADIFNADLRRVAIGLSTTTIPLQVNGDMRVQGVGRINTAMIGPGAYNGTQAGSDVWVAGRSGVPALGTERLSVNGSGRFDGGLYIDGLLSTGAVNVSNLSNITGNLTVSGTGRLRSSTVQTTAAFGGTSTFGGDSNFQGSIAIAGNLGAGANALNSPELYVNGNAFIANRATAGQSVVANVEHCINGNCRTHWETQRGPANTVIRALHVDGTAEYADPNCSGNTFFQGLNADGTPICRAFPTPTCAANTYVSYYDNVLGGYTCKPIPPDQFVSQCPPGTYIRSITNGVANCAPVELLGQSCTTPGYSARQIFPDGSVDCQPSFRPNNCPAGRIARGIAANGTVDCIVPGVSASCGPNEVVTGYSPGTGSPICGYPSVNGGSCGPNGVQSVTVNAAVGGCM